MSRRPTGPPVWHVGLFLALLAAGMVLFGVVEPAAFRQLFGGGR